MTGMDDPGRPSADGRAGQPGRGEYAQSNGGGDGDKGDDYRDRGEKQIKVLRSFLFSALPRGVSRRLVCFSAEATLTLGTGLRCPLALLERIC